MLNELHLNFGRCYVIMVMIHQFDIDLDVYLKHAYQIQI